MTTAEAQASRTGREWAATVTLREQDLRRIARAALALPEPRQQREDQPAA
jgi:hypothetical protein